MANAILLKRSNVPGKIPLTTDLDLGAMAINTHDGKVFIKKDDGTPSIIEVGINVKYINSDYNAINNELLVCESSGTTLGTGLTSYTITLPPNPNDKDIIRIMDANGDAQNRPILVSRNGNNIDGKATDLTCDVNYFDIKLVYNVVNTDWSLSGK